MTEYITIMSKNPRCDSPFLHLKIPIITYGDIKGISVLDIYINFPQRTSQKMPFTGIVCWLLSFLIFAFGELFYLLKYKGVYGRKKGYFSMKMNDIYNRRNSYKQWQQYYLNEEYRLNNEITSCTQFKNQLEESPTYENYVSIMDGS